MVLPMPYERKQDPIVDKELIWSRGLKFKPFDEVYFLPKRDCLLQKMVGWVAFEASSLYVTANVSFYLIVILLCVSEKSFLTGKECAHCRPSHQKTCIFIYLTGFAKTWLKNFQEHFDNLTSKWNGKSLAEPDQ